nr:MAG TPA_asm: hypothetical protein [Caudoviricetes sp.]
MEVGNAPRYHQLFLLDSLLLAFFDEEARSRLLVRQLIQL